MICSRRRDDVGLSRRRSFQDVVPIARPATTPRKLSTIVVDKSLKVVDDFQREARLKSGRMVVAYQRHLFPRQYVREDISRGVLEPVAREFGVTVEQMISRDQTRLMRDARLVAVGLLRRHGPSALSRLLGREHSTIIRSERSFDQRPDLQAIASRL